MSAWGFTRALDSDGMQARAEREVCWPIDQCLEPESHIRTSLTMLSRANRYVTLRLTLRAVVRETEKWRHRLLLWWRATLIGQIRIFISVLAPFTSPSLLRQCNTIPTVSPHADFPIITSFSASPKSSSSSSLFLLFVQIKADSADLGVSDQRFSDSPLLFLHVHVSAFRTLL